MHCDPAIHLAADDDLAPLWQGWQTKPRWVVPQIMARKRNGDDGAAVGLLRFSIGGLGETGEGVTTVNGMSHAPGCHHNAVTSLDYEVNGSAGFEIVRSPGKRLTQVDPRSDDVWRVAAEHCVYTAAKRTERCGRDIGETG